MRLRGALSAATTVAALLVAADASAWQEAHETGDDAVVQVDAAGVASVEHSIKWHVVRGPLKTIDLVHVDPAVLLEPDVPIATEDGRTLLAHAARHDDRTVRITIDTPRELMRGNFTFDVKWKVDLVATHALAPDGAMWRLTWSAPVASDGFDSVHTVLDFAAAPEAPTAILVDTGEIDESAVSTMVRQADSDRLELVRPHVARGEAPTWTVRVDARALSQVPPPVGKTSAESVRPEEPDRVRETAFAGGLAALGLLFGLIVARKSRTFAAACKARGGKARGLLPGSSGARAALAGMSLAAGVGLELRGWLTAGAAFVAVAILAAAQRAPMRTSSARGPGRWLALKPEDAFAPTAATWTTDALAMVLWCAAVGALAMLTVRFDADAPWITVLDALAFVPLLVTGRASQLPIESARASAPWLARVFRALRRIPGLRVSPWARVPVASDTPDELRLMVLPRAAMPGVLGIELGLVWTATPVGWCAFPEVLARVLEGSSAAAKLARHLPGMRVVPGRRPDERVLRLAPRSATRAAAISLSRSLAETLTDRRDAKAVPHVWTSPERRMTRPLAALRAPVAA